MEENKLTQELTDDTLDLEISLMEDEEIMVKFYNFECICLYAYVNKSLALKASGEINAIRSIVNTPMELYESRYMAELMTPDISDKQLFVFAVNVVKSIYDELDLLLEKKIKKDGRSADEIKQCVSVVRHLGMKGNGKNAKAYISYTLQKAEAIEAGFPI